MNRIKFTTGILMSITALWGGFYVGFEVIPKETWNDLFANWWGLPACLTHFIASVGLFVGGIVTSVYSID